MNSLPSSIRVLNTNLIPTSYSELSDWLYKHAGQKPCKIFDFTNTHIVTLRASNPEFQMITESVDYFIPDSMPLTWCVNCLGGKMEDRVYGPLFMEHCLKNSPENVRHYFLGGSQDCLDQLLDKLRAKNPHLTIVGARNGYFSSDEEQEIIDEINDLVPNCIWIGLGTPKQQQFVDRYKASVSSGSFLLVGFAFDVNAGTKSDAPLFFQKLGLTWLFRMASEPKRLAPRYLKYNSLYLFFLFQNLLTGLIKKFIIPIIGFFLLTYVAGLGLGMNLHLPIKDMVLLAIIGPICAIGTLLTSILTMSFFDIWGNDERIPKAIFSLNVILSILASALAPVLLIASMYLQGLSFAFILSVALIICTFGGIILTGGLVIFAICLDLTIRIFHKTKTEDLRDKGVER